MTNVRRILTVVFALALTLVLSPMSQASASVVTLGKVCGGVRAVRCAWVNHDTTNNRVRGYGSVRDTTSGADAVRVSVTLLRWNSTYERFEGVSSGGPQSDYDFVQAGTGLVTCGDTDLPPVVRESAQFCCRRIAVGSWQGEPGAKL
jgi:hypothetical protein